MKAPRWTNRPLKFRQRRPALETLPEYASRVLRYAIIAGPYNLDAEQRRLADAAAQRAQAELSKDERGNLDGPGQLILARLSSIRHAIARLDAIERAQVPTLPLDPQHPTPGTQGGRPAPLLGPPPPQLPPQGIAQRQPAPAELLPRQPRPAPTDGIRF